MLSSAPVRLVLPCAFLCLFFRLSAAHLRKDFSRNHKELAVEQDNSTELQALDGAVVSFQNSSLEGSLHHRRFGDPWGVVHFLFVANDSVTHPEIWGHFFSVAPRDSWRVWVHCKHPTICGKSRFFDKVPAAQLVPTVVTEYCTDLVTAMAQLLRVSLGAQDERLELGTTEKFAFVGDTTLPIKPFTAVHEALMAEPEQSDLCVHPSKRWRSANVNGTTSFLVKHSQWAVFSKRHAEEFVHRWVPVDHGNWQVPIVAGARPEDGLLHWKFRGDWQSGVCTDEWALFATLFGSFAPDPSGSAAFPGFGALRGNSTEAQGRCRTFVLPDRSRNWLGALAEPILGAADADPSQARTRGYEGEAARGTHPMSFLSVGNITLSSLRASPFLFARKFPPESDAPFFDELILA